MTEAAGAEPVQEGPSDAAFFFLDVQGFSRSERSEDDRIAVRRVLQDLAGDLLGNLGASQDLLAESSDTGDGLLCVLPPSSDPADLLIRFYPELDRRLTQHNRASTPQQGIRVRVVFAEGAVRRDTPTLTGPGIVGATVNSAARLLNSEQLRGDLALATGRSCSLMVSDRFYRATVEGRVPWLAASFRRTVVRSADGDREAWLHRPGVRDAAASPRPPAGTQIELADLTPRLFVSSFDVHVFDLYRQSSPAPPLSWQLATALLLSDGAVVHSADPYRRDEARTVLERFRDFVHNGEILFLLGGAVGDIRRDYPDYLENKARDYAASSFGTVDVRSLEGPLREPGALSRAVDLLESSPVRLKRGYSGTTRFKSAIRTDLRPSEQMVSSTRPASKLRTLNLTLYQLLTFSHTAGGPPERIIADMDQIEEFIGQIDRLLDQPIISRQILIAAVRNHFGRVSTRPNFLFELIEARIHSLYMSATTFPHAHTEVTPRRDAQSPYYYGHLRDHLRIVADEAGVSEPSPTLVRELMECPQWPEFRGHHLACLAELAALRLADQIHDADSVFRRHRRNGAFRMVAQTIKRQYS